MLIFSFSVTELHLCSNETYWTSADWRRHRKRKGLSLTPPQMQAEPQAQVVVAN